MEIVSSIEQYKIPSVVFKNRNSIRLYIQNTLVTLDGEITPPSYLPYTSRRSKRDWLFERAMNSKPMFQLKFDYFHWKQEVLSSNESVPPNMELTIKNILNHNHNWERYKIYYRNVLTSWQIEVIERMLGCREYQSGSITFYCDRCGETICIPSSCHSRICPRCGKKHTLEWGNGVCKILYDVPHRHMIFTLPEELWIWVRKDWDLVKAMFRAVNSTIQRMFDKRFGKNKVTAGIICVAHFAGRDMKDNPHIHVILTEGGLDGNERWRKHWFLDYDIMRKIWQHEVLKRFRRIMPNTYDVKHLIDMMYKHKKFKNDKGGFVIKDYRDIDDMKKIIHYIARYIKHPPIGESRIIDYDGKNITIKYEWENKIHQVKIDVMDFIDAIVRTIPPKGFQIVRYYGIYSNSLRQKVQRILKKIGLFLKRIYNRTTKQLKLFGNMICSKCGNVMEVLMISYYKHGEWVEIIY